MTPGNIRQLIEPIYFVADGVFATKSGEVAIILRYSGPDPECMEEEAKESITRRWQKVLGTLGNSRIYQYFLKRRAADGSFSMESFMVLMSAIHYKKNRWKNSTVKQAIEATRFAAQEIQDRASALKGQSDFLNMSILGSADAWAFLRRLLNYDEVLAAAIPFRESGRLDRRLSDSPVEVHGGHLLVGEHFVKVMTLKDPPSGPRPDFMRAIREVNIECIAVIEWRPEDNYTVRKLIAAKTAHFHRSKYAGTGFLLSVLGAIKNMFSATPAPQERPEDMQKDKAAAAHEEELGDLIKELETTGSRLGVFAMTIILHSATEIPATNEVLRSLAASDAVMYEERINALSAWVAALPGGHKHQFRSMYLTDSNHADMSMVFSVSVGFPVDALAQLDTRQNSKYDLSLHVGDVFHTAIIGQTGGGKSYSCSHLLGEAIRRYSAHVVIFDIGGSYRSLVKKHNGSYMDLGIDNPFTMAPFSLPDTPENRIFLQSFVRVLMEANGYRMVDPRDDSVIEDAIKGVYQRPEGERCLSGLELPERLGAYLHKWRGAGRYASLFDNVEDTLTTNALQVFDFEALDLHKEVIEPFLFYVFHRVSEEINRDPARLKIFVVDECHKFLMNESAKGYIRNAFKTFRKKNAGIWIATQSLEDMKRTGMDETVAENCASLLFLPNPGMKSALYREAFHLNSKEIDAILTMRPKRELLFKRPDGSKILQLIVKDKPCIEQSSAFSLVSAR